MPSLFIEDLSKPGKAIALNPDSSSDDYPIANGDMLVGMFCNEDTAQGTRNILASTSITIYVHQNGKDWITVQVKFNASQQATFGLSLKDIFGAKLHVDTMVLELSYR